MSSIVISGDTSGAITLQSPAVAGTNTVNFGANTGTAILDANTPAFRNRIINGAMVIDQRNAGASVVNGGGSTYFVDRWLIYDGNGGSHFTVQQNKGSVTPPVGYTNYLGLQTTTALSAAAGNNLTLTQYIEGFNTSDLGWGASGASSVTYSFWVRSSLTGTFAGQLQSGNSDAFYVFNYTINSANTWEQKTITITGPTIGTWSAGTNNRSIACRFDLGCGSTFAGTPNTWSASPWLTTSGAVSLVGTLNATFYITGVQLEKGSTATSFDYRPYGTELALCQRYFQKVGDGGNPYAVLGVGRFSSTTNTSLRFPWSVVMRTTPTASFNTATYQFTDGTSSRSVGAISIYSAGTDGCEGDVATTSATNGNMTQLRGNAASPNAPYINLSAEL